jgi:hypothetical protein
MFNARTRKVIAATVLAFATASAPALAVTPANSTVVNTLNLSGNTASQCLATDANKTVISTGAACGTGSGTVTAVTGSGNILSSGGSTPNITTVTNPTFSGTVTAGQVIDSGLTASQGVATNGSSQLISSGEAAPTTYIAGARAGGLHVEIKQIPTSATTPWEATVTFGAAYSVAPLCTATSFNSGPNPIPVDIVSESTTAAVIFDGSESAAVFNVICIGF